MQSIFLFGVYCSFFLIATAAPFVLALGYVWIDLFRPQIVNPGIMGMFPLSMIMGIAVLVAYFSADRRDPPKFSLVQGLMVAYVIWMVVNTYTIAVLAADAPGKLDWASKTVVFAILIPYFFRSRVQIEAMILTVLAASAGNVIAFAGKVAVGGSYYGQALGLSRSDFGFGESSTFSMICAALVPLILYVMKHSVIIPRFPLRNIAHYAACGVCILALIGTHARTGIIALGALVALLWLQSRHKLLLAGAAFGAVFVTLPFLGQAWLARMDTINAPTQESSALGRIAVWKWTMEYVAANPLGGGFEIYRTNRYSMMMADGTPFTIAGKAFHSIYFEVLGELGYPGLILMLSMFAITFVHLVRLRRQTRDEPDLEWVRDLALALTTSLIIYMVGGAFVGVAFQPLHYDWMSLTVALAAYLARYRREQLAEAGVSHTTAWKPPELARRPRAPEGSAWSPARGGVATRDLRQGL